MIMIRPVVYRRTTRPKERIWRWHFCQNCAEWPTDNYEQNQSTAVPFGAFCRECLRLRRAGECEGGLNIRKR